MQSSPDQRPSGYSQHYAKGALAHLVPLICELITKQVCTLLMAVLQIRNTCPQEETDDEDDWTLSKAATICLTRLAACCKDDIVQVHLCPPACLLLM
jgi:hypothetical protein